MGSSSLGKPTPQKRLRSVNHWGTEEKNPRPLARLGSDHDEVRTLGRGLHAVVASSEATLPRSPNGKDQRVQEKQRDGFWAIFMKLKTSKKPPFGGAGDFRESFKMPASFWTYRLWELADPCSQTTKPNTRPSRRNAKRLTLECPKSKHRQLGIRRTSFWVNGFWKCCHLPFQAMDLELPSPLAGLASLASKMTRK